MTTSVTQLMNLTNMLQMSGLSNSAFGQSMPYINSIFGIYSGYASGNTDGEVQSTMNIVSLLTGLLEKFACNETAKAEREVEKSKDSIVKNEEIVTKFADTGIKEIDNYIAKVEEQLVEVQKIIAEMGEESKKVATQNAELEAQKQIIADNVAIVNSSKDENEQADQGTIQGALANITAAGNKIGELVGSIQEISGKISSYQATIQTATTEIETNLTAAQDKVLSMADEIQGITVEKGSETVATTVTMGTEAATNEAVAAAAGTAATGASIAQIFTFGATSGAAYKADQVAVDQAGAGAVRLAGVANNMTGLGAFLSKGTEKMAEVGTYATVVGQAAASSAALIAEANILSDTLNIAVGAWNNYLTASCQIAQTVTEYNSTLKNSENNQTNGNDSNSNSSNKKLDLDVNKLFAQKADNAKA